MYKPKKKKYNSLKQLYIEMTENNVKVKSFDGVKIVSKKHKYTLLDGIISVKEE
jgi:hypothetical protein